MHGYTFSQRPLSTVLCKKHTSWRIPPLISYKGWHTATTLSNQPRVYATPQWWLGRIGMCLALTDQVTGTSKHAYTRWNFVSFAVFLFAMSNAYIKVHILVLHRKKIFFHYPSIRKRYAMIVCCVTCATATIFTNRTFYWSNMRATLT